MMKELRIYIVIPVYLFWMHIIMYNHVQQWNGNQIYWPQWVSWAHKFTESICLASKYLIIAATMHTISAWDASKSTMSISGSFEGRKPIIPYSYPFIWCFNNFRDSNNIKLYTPQYGIWNVTNCTNSFMVQSQERVSQIVRIYLLEWMERVSFFLFIWLWYLLHAAFGINNMIDNEQSYRVLKKWCVSYGIKWCDCWNECVRMKTEIH